MVIEYSGNVIRSVLTDKREKYYDGKVRIRNLPCRSPQRCVGPTTAVFSPPPPTGNRLLHVSHRRLRGGRRNGARQRRALHQPFLRAQLLLSRHHRGRQETHRDLRIPPHLPRRGAHLRLQVPHRGGQQQAALQLQLKEVPQVPQLKIRRVRKRRVGPQDRSVHEDDPADGLSSRWLSFLCSGSNYIRAANRT